MEDPLVQKAVVSSHAKKGYPPFVFGIGEAYPPYYCGVPRNAMHSDLAKF